MVVGSVVRPRLVEAAIELFGVYGYEGVTMRQLARAARTTAGTLYRLFSRKKEKVYEAAVKETQTRALKAVAESVFLLVDDPRTEDAPSRVGQALKLWYNRLGEKEARLLQQIEIADPNRRKDARTPSEKMAKYVGRALEKICPGAKSDLLHEHARTMVDGLFQLKLSNYEDAKEKMEGRVNAFVLFLPSK